MGGIFRKKIKMGRFTVSLFEIFVPVSVSGDHIYDDSQRASATI